jgi:pantoate--beta-alanine ligase
MPLIVSTREHLATAREAMPGRVAVVMTMGAFHEGHVRLIQTAHDHADSVLVTIFVNPLQFGAGEDFQRYPRDLDADLAICAREGVDVVFAPDVDVMYPRDEVLVRHHPGRLGGRLEGAIRPTHFGGVLTVVARLLELTRPDVAIFGEKDAQQLELIRRMVAEHGFPVELVSVGIVREPDGLAMSSRNVYLSPSERVDALAISRALSAGAEAAEHGPAAALAQVRAVLDQARGVEIDYLELVDEKTWLAADEDTSEGRILVAGRVGSTRLIDNVSVRLGHDQHSDRGDRQHDEVSEGA